MLNLVGGGESKFVSSTGEPKIDARIPL